MKLIKAMAVATAIFGAILAYAPPDEPTSRSGKQYGTLPADAPAEAARSGEDARDGVDLVWLAFGIWAVCWVVVIAIEWPTGREEE